MKLNNRFEKYLKSLIILFFLLAITATTGCSMSSNSGGSTGGNPATSSLPLQVSLDLK